LRRGERWRLIKEMEMGREKDMGRETEKGH
jgi:hypothetical protein